MPLVSGQHMGAGDLNLTRLPREEDWQKGVSSHRFIGFQTSSLEKSGCKIAEGDEVLDGAAAFDFVASSHRKRNSGAGVVECGLAARERHAVVTTDYDDGILKLTHLFQLA